MQCRASVKVNDLRLSSAVATGQAAWQRVRVPPWRVGERQSVVRNFAVPVKGTIPPPCGYVGRSLPTILNESRTAPLGTSETTKAGELVLHGRYPFHENLTDIANASDGKIPNAAKPMTAEMSAVGSILLSFAPNPLSPCGREQCRVIELFLLAGFRSDLNLRWPLWCSPRSLNQRKLSYCRYDWTRIEYRRHPH